MKTCHARPAFDPVEIEFLVMLYPHWPAEAIARLLRNTPAAVTAEATRLGLAKPADAPPQTSPTPTPETAATSSGVKTITRIAGATITRHTMR